VTAAHRAGRYNDPNRREILREHQQRESLEALTSTSAAPRQPTAVGERSVTGRWRHNRASNAGRPPDRPITGQAPLRDTERFPVDHPREGMLQPRLVDQTGAPVPGKEPHFLASTRRFLPRSRYASMASSRPATSEPRLGPAGPVLR